MDGVQIKQPTDETLEPVTFNPSSRSRRSSGGYEPELPMAHEMKEGVEFIMDRLLHYIRLSKFYSHMPFLKDRTKLQTAHQQTLFHIQQFMESHVSDVFTETDVISKLNDLWQLIQDTPVTFNQVWRPSGDPKQDIQDHLKSVNEKFNVVFAELLLSQQKENSKKLQEIKTLERDLITIRGEIQSVSDSL